MKSRAVRFVILAVMAMFLTALPSVGTQPVVKAKTYDACQDCMNFCQADYQECVSSGLPPGVCWQVRNNCRADCRANECAGQ